MNLSLSKKILLIFGWYNIIGAFLTITFFKMVFPLIYGIEYIKPDHELLLMNHIIIFGFVGIVGLGLVKAAKDPVQNKTIIMVSALGKLFACATWTLSYFKSVGTILLVFSGFSDALIAVAFLIILKNIPKQ